LSRKNWTIRFQKLDYPVYAGLTTRTELTPSLFHSFLSFVLSSFTVKVTPRPPLVIPWFHCEILEFLGEINSPRTGVSDSPTNFPHLKVFSLNPRSPCSMDGFAIPLVHWFYSCHRSIPCSISKFPRVKSAQIELSGFGRQTLVYEF
jgi:hypothetical protein